MASLISGFEYDIFISYRQKDNKNDSWVSNFVEDLKGELQATFKDEVSLYFDVNPHNGLLETHDVDASLRNKLKCLIFIPIVSRTYCDPKSFAWEHELKAFLRSAANDGLGLMVKLPGGNIAARVLPVRIHELGQSDLQLLEDTLGFHLRGIEFIYKEPGVNKPLTIEDDEKKNLNKTKYRIQINRTANAIQELITGMIAASEKSSLAEQKPESNIVDPAEKEIPGKKNKLPYIMVSALTVLIGAVLIFLFASGTNLPFKERDWVLITDFENQTGNQVFDKSLYTAFTLTASQSRYLNVFPRSRMIEALKLMNAASGTIVDEKTGREIAVREGISIVVVPAISETGSRYAISAKIVEASSESPLQSIVLYADSQDKILPTLDALSHRLRRLLGESRYNISLQDKPLAKVTTSSLDALKVYSAGVDQTLNLEFRKAADSYESALRIDTGFVAAKASLGITLFEKFDRNKGKKYLIEAIKGVENLTEREKLGILAFHAVAIESDLRKAIKYANARSELYPDDLAAHNNLGWYYQNLKEYTQAAREYKEVLRINPRLALSHAGLIWVYFDVGQLDSAIVWSEKMIQRHPSNPWGYAYMGSALMGIDSLKKATIYFKKAREVDPDMVYNLYRYAHACRLMGDYPTAISLLNHLLEVDKYDLPTYRDLGVMHSRMGNLKEAAKYYTTFERLVNESWVKEFPDNSSTYTHLAVLAAMTGESDKSDEFLDKAISLDSTNHEEFAAVKCAQNNIPEALHEIDLAFRGGFRDIVWIKMHPSMEVFRYDTRFHDLVKKYFK